MRPAVALGTQGWAYADWVGPMYDAGTRAEHFLRAYAREFSSVGVDATWYGTPPPERVRTWCAAVPAAFTFALKLPREITHERRLVACEALLDEFVERALDFGTKLEGVLVQLPPDFTPLDDGTLDAFLRRLPAGPRWSIELRDPGWFVRETYERLHDALARAGVALVACDGTFVALEHALAAFAEPTARHGYIRWLGAWKAVEHFNRVIFDHSEELRAWAHAVHANADRLDRVCGYASNFYTGHAPAAVRAFYAALGLPHTPPPRIEQTSLF